MKWKNINVEKPKDKWILVIGKNCNLIHSLHFDYDEYLLPESCDKDKYHSPGQSIDFEYWIPMPPLSNQSNFTFPEDY